MRVGSHGRARADLLRTRGSRNGTDAATVTQSAASEYGTDGNAERGAYRCAYAENAGRTHWGHAAGQAADDQRVGTDI